MSPMLNELILKQQELKERKKLLTKAIRAAKTESEKNKLQTKRATLEKRIKKLSEKIRDQKKKLKVSGGVVDMNLLPQ